MYSHWLHYLHFNDQGNFTHLHTCRIFHLYPLSDLIAVDQSPTTQIFHLQPSFADPDPSMALSNSLTLDREHVAGSFRTDHELRFTSIDCADDACWSVEGD